MRQFRIIAPSALGLVLLLDACTSSAPGAHRSSAPPPTTAPTASSPAGSIAPSKGAVRTPTTTAALRSCSISTLTLSDTGTDDHRSGLAYGTIEARNTGSETCTVTGYPGVVLVAGQRATATTLSRARGSIPHTVTLKPGQLASFGFSHKAYSEAAHCDQITGARVYDPDGSGYKTTATAFTECEGVAATGLKPVPITVGPFRAGTSSTLI